MKDIDADDALKTVLTASITEQRRARRWGIFFKFIFILYLGMMILPFISMGKTSESYAKSHVGVISIYGEIKDKGPTAYDAIAKGLKRAYKSGHLKGIILDINSPGGLPAQSHLVFEEIMRLRKKHPEIPVYATIADVGASGAYYIAAAADEIYAVPSSIVGSIGVVSMQFGFVETAQKLGVEPRIQSAGEHKTTMNPFEPVTPEDYALHQALLDNVHQQFIEAVKLGRGERLSDDDLIFSGLFWSGEQALGYGLIDGLGSRDQIAREKIGEENLVYYNTGNDPLERLLSRLPTSELYQGLKSIVPNVRL